jgi:ketosteroid isomerase-like protein
MPEKPVSDSERAAIEKSVKAVVDETIRCAERVDFDAICRQYADLPATSIMNVGYFYPSLKVFDAAFRPGFSRLARQTFAPDETRVTVLSHNAAFVAVYGNATSVTKDGAIGGGHFCLTFVLTTVDGSWRIVHAHQSFVR